MRSWRGWALRRAGASAPLLLTLLALVAVTSGILAFTLGNAGVLATSAARDALRSADPGKAGVSAQTRLGPDAEAQDALGREQLAEGFSPAPVEIWTTYLSEPRRTSGAPISQPLILWAGNHLGGDNVEIVAGTWPAGPSEAALHSGAAEIAGITEGTAVEVDGHRLTITALWRPRDVTAPLWFGEKLALEGTTGAHLGPLVVDRSVLTGGAPYIRWSVVPDVTRISPADLTSLADGAARARELVKSADVTGRGILASGDLAETAQTAARDFTIGEAFGFVPVSLLLLVAVVALVQVAGLLAATREREVSLLLARGASRRQLLAAGIAEAAVLATLGAAVGTGIAAVAVRVIAGDDTHLPTVAWAGLASAGLSVACLAAVTASSTFRLARGGQPRSDRLRAVVGAAALVVVCSAAALAAWQLRQAGTFVVATPDGTIRADVLSALAPALLLAAAAVVGLAALAPVTRLLEWATRRTRSVAVWLAGMQLARGLVVQAVPVVLTILATGTATLASLYSGSYAEAQRDLDALSQGAPLRATLAEAAPGRPLELPALSGIDGVGEALPVWRQERASVGDLQVAAIAAPLDQLGSVLGASRGVLDAVAAGPEGVAAIDIPAGTTSLTVTLGGELYLDPWQQREFATLPEYLRRLADALPSDQRDLQYRFAMDSTADEYRTAATVKVELLVRDPRSGLSAILPGPRLEIPAPQVTLDADATQYQPASATIVGEVAVPEGGVEVAGVRLVPESPRPTVANRSLSVSLGLEAGGVALLGGATAQWVGDTAILAGRYGTYADALASAGGPTVEVVERDGFIVLESNRPDAPLTTIDPTGPVWKYVSPAGADAALVVGPEVRFTADGADGSGVMTDLAQPRVPPVNVAITPALADAASLDVGDTLEVTAFGHRSPAVVAAVTRDIPALTAPQGMLLDSRALSRVAAAAFRPMVWPTEMWGSLDGDPAAVRDALLRSRSVDAVSFARPADATMSASATAFWVAAASALVLAVTGVAAASATLISARRPEVAILRAVGVRATDQAISRGWEIGSALALATGAGIAGGWGVARLVVAPVARAASGGELAEVPLAVDLPPLVGLLAVGTAGVAAVGAAVAAAVRRQALDNEYREEVR